MAGAVPLVLRDGRPEDVPAVHEAILALARHIGAEYAVLSRPEHLLQACFSDKPDCRMTIAELDGSFAGMCLHFPAYSTWMGCTGAYIQDLYVDPSARGRGVGEALLRQVARGYRDAGAGYLRLSVDVDNHSAVGFYERLGIAWAEYERIQKIGGAAFHAFCDGRPVDELPKEEGA